MPQRCFPQPWRFEPIPGGYRVIDASGLALAHVYGEPQNAIAISDKRLTNNEAEKIARLPNLVEIERDQNRARSRRKPQPLRFKPVTIGDLSRTAIVPSSLHCKYGETNSKQFRRGPCGRCPDLRCRHGPFFHRTDESADGRHV
jgi:hypothetical protein